MTALPGAHPALATLAAALAPAATGTPPAPGLPTASAPGAPAAGAAPFSAFLLEMRPGARPGAAATLPAPPPGTLPPTTATDAPPAPGLAAPGAAAMPMPALPAPAGRDPLDGQDLPVDGSTLPPEALEALLASLEQPKAASPAPAPAPPPDPLTAGHAAPAGTPAQGPPASPGAPGTARPGNPQRPELPASQAAVPAGGDATAPIAARDPEAPFDAGRLADGRPPGAPADGPRGMDLALPMEFRARLDAALALAGRPPPLPDAGAALFAAVPPAAPASPTVMPAAGSGLPEALPPLQPLADHEAWSRGLGERLLLMADKGLQAATLRLQPEHLGPLEVHINVDEDGATQVLFSAHHAQARDALESAMPRLRELFAEQGLSLTQANVDAGGNSAFAQRGFAGGLPAWPRYAGPAPEPRTDAGVQAWQLARPSDRRVDVLV